MIILGEHHETKQKEKIDLIKSIPLTYGWSEENCNGILRQIKEAKYKRNQIIYDIGDSSEYIYIIKEGEVEVIYFEFC